MTQLLGIVLLSSFSHCWSEIVSTKGFLTVTDKTYQSSQLAWLSAMGEYSQYMAGTDDRAFESGCKNKCLMDDNCLTSSVVYKTLEKRMICRWTGTSFCAGTVALTPVGTNTPVRTWEKKLPDLDTRSCFEICVDTNNGNCTACSRENCRGQLCSDCPATCEQLRRYNNCTDKNITVGGRIEILWPLGTFGAFRTEVPCSGDWVVIFKRHWSASLRIYDLLVNQQYFSSLYSNTNRTLFMIELITEEDQVYRAVYQGFDVSSTSLTILRYLNNSAAYQDGGSSDPGDGFKAPLYNAPFIVRNNSLCGSFWDIGDPMFSNSATASQYPLGYNESSFDSCASGTYFFGPSYYENSTGSDALGVPVNHTGMAWSTLPGVRIKAVYFKAKDV